MEGKKNMINMQQKSISPIRLALKKLLRNPLSIVGLLIISFFLIVVVLGPIIRLDGSPKANNQHLEIARKLPGFQVQMLHVPLENPRQQSFFDDWLYGKPLDYTEIPISTVKKSNQGVIFTKYTGSSEVEGEQLAILSKQNYEVVSKTYWLGTDRYGRDLLSRIFAGTWISFTVGLISIIISLIIGISLGSSAAYFGGKVDSFIMWIINVIWSIPTLLLVIAMTLALGKGFWQVFVAVGLTMWVEVARVVRGQVLGVKQKEFIEAGKAFGFRNSRIIFKHILPNITGPIIVISASNFAAAILIEAGLSFLGLGAQPPQATWGKMISEHKGYIITGDAYLAIFPGIAICLLVLSFVLLGNGLRDAFDTKGVKNLSL